MLQYLCDQIFLKFVTSENLIKWVRGAVDSADEKVTKCHVRGEVAGDSRNVTNDNLIIWVRGAVGSAVDS